MSSTTRVVMMRCVVLLAVVRDVRAFHVTDDVTKRTFSEGNVQNRHCHALMVEIAAANRRNLCVWRRSQITFIKCMRAGPRRTLTADWSAT